MVWLHRLAVIFSLLLLAGSIYRAATLPFVHDESLSFAIFTIEPRVAQMANHHLLNTWAMQASASLFGFSELALRLPNVLAHAVYLCSVLSILRRIEEPWLRIAGFVALNLNPFALDFFCLARGYGLGLAALTGSLVLLLRGSEETEISVRRRWLLGALAAGAVSVLSNFAFLFFYITLHGVIGALYFARGFRRWDRAAIFAAGSSALFLGFVGSRVWQLVAHDELYFGGSEGFLRDTVRSLIESTLYGMDYPASFVSVVPIAIAGTLLVVIGMGLWRVLKKRTFGPDGIFVVLLCGTVLLPIASHAFGRSLLPLDRAALPYLPLSVGAALFTLARWLHTNPAPWWAPMVRFVAAVLAALGTAHFAASYNVSSCHIWAYDANNKAMLELVRRDCRRHEPAAQPNLAVNWHFAPSILFYRVVGPGSWLASVTKLHGRRKDEDYAYVFESEAVPLVAENYRVLARFEDTRTVLLSRR